MDVRTISSDEAQNMGPDDLLSALASDRNGLAGGDAAKRLQQFGPNALEEKKRNPLKEFLKYFRGPIPWMIEAAAVLSLLIQHWADFAIIVVMLLFNALVSFWQEHKAADALDALKAQLALTARALRDGSWQEIEAKDLVPGDIIRLRLGDVIPADVKLLEGDYLSVDQAALTGESFPVNKKPGDVAYSGSSAKQGEMIAAVTATGANTFFGKTAKLVEHAGATSHFQQAVMKVGDFLIFTAVGLSIILVAVELHRGEPWMSLLQFVLILVVASIPVAMPAVLSVTMALGALALSKMKAIVSRLQAIEEMAGIDILCSDKTGTLTLNQLTLGEPTLFSAKDKGEIILAASLASKEEDRDAIDLAVLGGLKDPSALKQYEQTTFTPFDPISKRTEALVKGPDGSAFSVSKGAPQVILDLCGPDDATRKQAEDKVDELAAKGYRTIGVARRDGEGDWTYLGILPLYDPPREDSAQTISEAEAHGISVKMITGDNAAIGREIARQLNMGTNIQPASQFFTQGVDPSNLSPEAAARIEKAEGFAEVFPEHKYGIVKALQDRGHLVAMTGDGVNDAPALKQADAGVAVSGATDAARAAAALVLTSPGLSVIIRAVEEARRIFERMMSYTIYRIAMTIDIMVFVVLAMIVFGFYPLTAVMIIVLALLDDIPIMTIAYDNTYLDPKPVKWDMRRVLSISVVLGFLAVIQTFGLLIVGKEYLGVGVEQLQSMIFLQLVAGGHLMLFVTRTRKAFWQSPYPAMPLFGAIVGTQIVGIVLVAFGLLVPQLSWTLIGIVWGYNIIWMVVQDIVKLGCYRLIEDRAEHKKSFLAAVNEPLHSHSHRHVERAR